MGMPKRINPGKAIRMRMEELRSEYGISYRRIAEKSQVPYSTVKSIACGYDRDITLGTLVSLANFFGMTMREFLDSEVFDLIDADARKQCKGTFGVEAPGDFMDSGHLIDDRYPWELDACGGPKALRGLEDIDGLEDFRELRKKSEEWILWNNSQYQHRQD